MKNILKRSLFAFVLISIGSCTNDKDPIPSTNGFTLRNVSAVTPPAVLLTQNDASVFAQFDWDKCNNGVASVSTYTIEISDHDADPTFAKAVEYSGTGISVSPELRNCSLKVAEFNSLLNKLPSFQCGVMKIDIRVKSTLGINPENAFVQYSNPITLSVTGYSTALPILTFVKDSGKPSEGAKILAKTFTSVSDYEGYMYLEAGTYKFFKPDPCGSFETPTVYGGASGVLTEGNSAASITVATAGHYLVKANLTPSALSYSVKYIKAFGVYGTAKSTVGSANIVPMTDENNTNKWKLTIDLIKGKKFRFKSNDWTGALTGSPLSVPPGAGTTVISILGSTSTPYLLTEYAGTGGDITVPGTDDGVRQKYDITLDVSNPRNYTYTLTLNPN